MYSNLLHLHVKQGGHRKRAVSCATSQLDCVPTCSLAIISVVIAEQVQRPNILLFWMSHVAAAGGRLPSMQDAIAHAEAALHMLKEVVQNESGLNSGVDSTVQKKIADFEVVNIVTCYYEKCYSL